MEFISLVENFMISEGVFCAVSDTGLGTANKYKGEQDCYCLKNLTIIGDKAKYKHGNIC